MVGSSSLHGMHHVAQNVTNTAFPRRSANAKCSPSMFRCRSEPGREASPAGAGPKQHDSSGYHQTNGHGTHKVAKPSSRHAAGVPAASGRRSRLSNKALTATKTLDPDIESAAISGRNTMPSGSNTPAAKGMAMLL